MLTEFPCTAADLVECGAALVRLNTDKSAIAERIFKAATALDPDNAHAQHNLGSILCMTGRSKEATRHLAHAVGLDPFSGPSWAMLASAYSGIGEFKRALSCGKYAIDLLPEDADLWYKLAGFYELVQDFAYAESCYARALELRTDPQTSYAFGIIKMLRGDYSYGLPLYEQRMLCQTPIVQPVPCTDVALSAEIPAAVVKQVVIESEQGIGDLFHMARYSEVLTYHYPNAAIILHCDKPLVSFMKRFVGFESVYPKDEAIPMGAGERITFSAMSLMYWAALYGYDVFQPPAKIEHQPRLERTGVRPRIGVCWKGNPMHALDRLRSLNDEDVAPLIGLAKTHDLVKLQFNNFTFTDYWADTPDLTGWDNTAEAILDCDLIITVDTAIAHLAGSLGKPVWLLLAATPDWRWGLEKPTTRWYPSVTIFRQRELLKWGPVIDEVSAKLEEL